VGPTDAAALRLGLVGFLRTLEHRAPDRAATCRTASTISPADPPPARFGLGFASAWVRT
jgi:hypothetical protein